jgi:hypothetical protein
MVTSAQIDRHCLFCFAIRLAFLDTLESLEAFKCEVTLLNLSIDFQSKRDTTCMKIHRQPHMRSACALAAFFAFGDFGRKSPEILILPPRIRELSVHSEVQDSARSRQHYSTKNDLHEFPTGSSSRCRSRPRLPSWKPPAARPFTDSTHLILFTAWSAAR